MKSMTILIAVITLATLAVTYRVGYGVGYLNGYNQGLQGEKTEPAF